MKRISILKKSAFVSFIFMKIDKNSVFSIITVAIVIVLFVLFQPKILPKLFGIRNQALLNHFTADTLKTKQINVQEFWKLREFYCPESFVFDKTKNPFLVYSCKWLHSEDSLVTSALLPNDQNPELKTVLLQTADISIYKTSKNLVISFIASGDEMQKANGFFDYAGKDKEYVKGKNWLDITEVSL